MQYYVRQSTNRSRAVDDEGSDYESPSTVTLEGWVTYSNREVSQNNFLVFLVL